MLQHFVPLWCIGIGKSLICISVTTPIVLTKGKKAFLHTN